MASTSRLLSLAYLAALFLVSDVGSDSTRLIQRAYSADARQLIDAPLFWTFSSIEDFYTHNQNPYIKVTEGKNNFLWDPTRNRQSPWTSSNLTALTNAGQQILGTVGMPPMSSAQILENELPGIDAATSWARYFTLVVDNSIKGKFYIAIRSPFGNIVNRFCCDSKESVESDQEDFQTPLTLWAFSVANHGVLLICVKPVVAILFKEVPTRPVNIADRLFVIPGKLIAPALEAAGPGLKARYAVVKKFIGESLLLNEPTLPVTVEDALKQQ